MRRSESRTRRWVAWATGMLLVAPPASGQVPKAPQGGTAALRPPAADAAARPAPGQAPAPAQGAGAAMPKPVDPAAERRMQELLREWEARSQDDVTIYTEFTRTDTSVELLKPRKFRGMALLHRPNKACLNFDEVSADGKSAKFHERIVATGDEVYHFLGPSQQVFVYPLAQDQRRRALEEGPLPFMFNMRVDEAQRRFQMDLLQEVPATDKLPPRSLIRIIPKLAIDREEYLEARVVLNMETFLPMALVLTLPNGKDTKRFDFARMERNGAENPATRQNNYNGKLMAAEFQKRGYKVIVNPDGAQDTAPATAGAQPAPRGPAPAGRPAVGQGAMPPRRN